MEITTNPTLATIENLTITISPNLNQTCRGGEKPNFGFLQAESSLMAAALGCIDEGQTSNQICAVNFPSVVK